ncbi:hypothetical protein ABZT03_33485 [Streptomyces sp. NPDC005574]|uniref:hypothetical protein n=1 Tax=Streptomyces sp. NPDC005574 TaxID=3156891 RepID=UPI0033B7A965
MSTHLRQPTVLPLPAAATPDGCLPWDAERAGRWAGALPPFPAMLRPRRRYLQLILAVGALAALGPALAGCSPWLAALAALHLVWLPLRPEAVRASAPALLVLAGVLRPAPLWAVLPGAVLLAGACWTVAELRLRARGRQAAEARAAAGGVTAPPPDQGREPSGRGRYLMVSGLVLALPGVGLLVTSGLWDAPEDRGGAAAAGLYVAGLGATAVLSGVLGRRRAAALAAAPAPVLRVLVRQDEGGGTEVFAADDTTALRPLFAVGTTGTGEDRDAPAPDPGSEAEARMKAEAGIDEFLDQLEDDRPGPLREAVLYGAPYDGAEILLVSAAPEPGGPPLVERSTGPVRPLSPGGARRRLAREKRAAARAAVDEEEHLLLVAAARSTAAPVPVRHWRAGAPDLLACVLLALWGGGTAWAAFSDTDVSLWQEAVVVAVGLYGACRLAVKLCWRITADRTGLWLNGLRRPTHIPWDDLRSVRREHFELKLRRSGGDSWAVAAPRWARLQRRCGLTHPYDTAAAELTVLHTDPALRPTGDSEERSRGRALWPLAVLFSLAWLAFLAATRHLL